MHNRIIIILFLTLFGSPLIAQNEVGCESLLEDAKEAYSGGMVELVPDILNPCLESGLSGELLQEAYKLVINAYLFDYLPESATAKMQDFVMKFPEYAASGSDTREFVQMHNTVKQEMDQADAAAAAIALAEEQAKAREEQDRIREEAAKSDRQEETREKERPTREDPVVDPAGDVDNAHSIGVYAGGVFLFPGMMERYSMTDPATDQGAFGQAVPGIHAGVAFTLNLSRSVKLGIGLSYDRLHLSFAGKPFPFSSYQYDEFQNRIGLPVSMEVDLNPDSKTVAYFRFGVAVDYLLEANASAVRSYDSGDAFFSAG